ncbi:hypothetical protein [Flavobacterium sp. DSP2-3-1]|uniref:hypothetical protein n=1 Tax=Flavobacterium sp. DSP2-3-1 TaxID=2804620 RepID=UPI003CED3AF8
MEDLVMEQQSNIETVSKNEAVSLVKNLHDAQRTTAKSIDLQDDFDFDKITQEKLTNTSELITIIPIKSRIQNQRRRALFLRVGAQIESMIYNEFAEVSSTQNSFDGIILMTRLNGDFIRAYRLKNNKYVVDLVPNKKNQSGQKGTQNTSRTIDGGDLHEVIVINSYKDPSTFVSLNEMGKEVPITISWNSLGSGGTTGDEEEKAIVFIGPDPEKVIKKINDYLKCFDLSKPAEVVIYVDQPIANNAKAWSGTDVGHTFIAIQQGNTRSVFGYWPSSSVYPATGYSTDVMAFGNDENHHFDVSIAVVVDTSKLLNIIAYANNAPTQYDLDNYNCTDFALEVGKLAGLPLSDSSGIWPGGEGSNPGQLGQDIRNMSLPANSRRQTIGANAASNNGTCN